MIRRTFLKTAAQAAAGLTLVAKSLRAVPHDPQPPAVLGQGRFRYRIDTEWGRLDPAVTPVDHCHAITENRAGQIVLLTNETRNNLVIYTKQGEFVSKRENRFPGAHALEFDNDKRGDEVLWITDNELAVVSLCRPDGREVRRLGLETVAGWYPRLASFHPTNVAVMPAGDFFVSDGYGSHRILHFDPDWQPIAIFGGLGDAPENLKQPHAVWLDQRRGRPELLVCDRAHEALKWFSLDHELLRVVPLSGARPCNVVAADADHLIIPCLNGIILVLDGCDRIVSVIGGPPACYVDGILQPLTASEDVFIHPHDAYIDTAGDIYVAQWKAGRSYPFKLHRELSAG